MRILFILSTLLLLGVSPAFASNSPMIYASPFNLVMGNGGLRFQQSDTTTACDASTAGSLRNNAGTIEACNGSAWSAIGAASGVTTMGAIGSSPNANGATISGSNLNLEPASGSFGGVVTTGAQTFAGEKTFSSIINPLLIGGTGTTSTLTLKTTTGVGTTNADMIFQVGNNGATEAARILNSGVVAIGTPSPSANAKFTVSLNTAASIAPNANTVFHGIGADNVSTRFNMDMFGTAGIPVINTRRARGTGASPTAVQTNDILGRWGGIGYGATGFATLASAYFTVKAGENWTDSAQGSYLDLSTTPNGSTTAATRLTIGNDGLVTLGVAGTSTGSLALTGATSGTVTIAPQAAAGTYNFNLPTSAGSSGQPLLSGGGGSTAQTYGTLGVAGGGTGATTLTANNVILGNGTDAVQFVAPGTSGNILTSNGTTWTSAAPAAGTAALSAITAATGTNTIENVNFAQAWEWDSLTSEIGLKLSSSSITTGSVFNVATTNASMSGPSVLINNNSTNAAGYGMTIAMTGANGPAGLNITSTTANAINVSKSGNSGATANLINVDAPGIHSAGSKILNIAASSGSLSSGPIGVQSVISGTASAARAGVFTLDGGTATGTVIEASISGTGYVIDAHAAGGATPEIIRLRNTETAANNNSVGIMMTANRTGTTNTEVAEISGLITDITAGAYKGAFVIKTANNAAPAERVRVAETGITTMNAYGAGVAQFSSAGVISSTAPSTSGNVLTSNGSAWVSSAPAAVSSGNTQTFTSSGTWTKPSVGTVTHIRCWGGGGGGGGSATNGAGGGGGGGGGFNEKWIATSSLGATETVTIGAGGTAGNTSGTAGGIGGNSTFGAHLTAYGGGGGPSQAQAIGGGGGGQTSAGGTATGVPGNPLISSYYFDGTNIVTISAGQGGAKAGSGYPATGAIFTGGGGGSVAGQLAIAGASSVYGGGGGGGGGAGSTGGGSAFGGAGGAGGDEANGTAGTQPGGGGGAANSDLTTGKTGGAGGAGQCIAATY